MTLPVARWPLCGQHGHRRPERSRPPSPPHRRGSAAAAAAAAEHFRRHGLIECGEHVRRRPEAERRGGHTKDVGLPGYLDAQGRRHTGPEFQVGVGSVDDGGVGRHVLHDNRLQSDLRDRPLEGVRGVGVDAERDALPGTNATDIGLVDVGADLQLGEVDGDDEQGGRLHARGHGLPDVHASLGDDAIDRRGDDGVIEVDLRLVEVGL